MEGKCSLRNTCWDRAHMEYTCVDGLKVACRFETAKISRSGLTSDGDWVTMSMFHFWSAEQQEIVLPKNGLQLW